MYLVLVPNGRNVRAIGRFLREEDAVAEARALVTSNAENIVEVVKVIREFRG